MQLSLGGTDATPAFNLSDATAYPGDSSLVTTGALNSGSITSGFGSIDIGSSALTAGAGTLSSLSLDRTDAQNFTIQVDGQELHADAFTTNDATTAASSTAAQDYTRWRIEAPTLTATNTAVTTTNAYTAYIAGPPVASTNQTITNAYALYVASGTTYLAGLTMGSVGVSAILDEDAMGSNSATALATQQSIKAYVDSQVNAQDLDFQGDSGGALSIDLDTETLTIAGDGTDIGTSGSSNTLTVSLSSVTGKTLSACTITGATTISNSAKLTTVFAVARTYDAAYQIALDAAGTAAAKDLVFLTGDATNEYQATKATDANAGTGWVSVMVDSTDTTEKFAKHGSIVICAAIDDGAVIEVGAPVYLSATAGKVTSVAPTGGSVYRRIVGFAAERKAVADNVTELSIMLAPQAEGELV